MNWRKEAKRAWLLAGANMLLYWLFLIGLFSVLTDSLVRGGVAFIFCEMALYLHEQYKEHGRAAKIYEGQANAQEGIVYKPGVKLD